MAFSTTPTEGADRLRATANNQTINALGGNDWLRSVFDASTLYGGNGHDQLSVSLGDAAPADAENITSATLFGGNGNDWLVSDFVAESADGFGYGFTSSQSGGDGNDNILISAEGRGRGSLNFEVFGGAGDDDIWIEEDTGSSTNTNVVDAGGGADTIYIASQVSSVGSEEGTTTNVVDAGDGDDDVFVYGEAGWTADPASNTVSGGEGNDRLEGMTDGANGVNTLDGGNGDDTLIATGEMSDEVFALSRNNADGGDGDDTIELSSLAQAIGARAVHTAEGGVGNDTITSITDTRSSEDGGLTSADTLLDGGSGNDVLTATTIFGAEDDASGGARLYGRTGDDVLRVYGGVRNTLDGGAGDDTITGGTGADRIIGGPGADTLRGGGGNDAFIFLFADGVTPSPRDTILDFGIGTTSRGDDVIDLSRIDANVNIAGNQAFVFGGPTQNWTGRLWVEENPDTAGSLVVANTGGPELLVIAVEDWASRDASDWVRGDFVL